MIQNYPEKVATTNSTIQQLHVKIIKQKQLKLTLLRLGSDLACKKYQQNCCCERGTAGRCR